MEKYLLLYGGRSVRLIHCTEYDYFENNYDACYVLAKQDESLPWIKVKKEKVYYSQLSSLLCEIPMERALAILLAAR